MRLAGDVRAQHVPEQVELGVAGGRSRGDVEDRAVVLAQPDRAIGRQLRGQVALLVLDHGERPNPVEERRLGRRRSSSWRRIRSAVWRRRAAKICSIRSVAAHRLDGREQARGEAVVVGREELLGVGGDVVQVARPADAVAHGPARDECVRLERAELLEDARPAGAEGRREVVRRGGPGLRRCTRMSRRRAGGGHRASCRRSAACLNGVPGSAGGELRAVAIHRKASRGPPARCEPAQRARRGYPPVYAPGGGPRPLAGARAAPRDDPRLHGDRGRAGRRGARAGTGFPRESSAGWARWAGSGSRSPRTRAGPAWTRSPTRSRSRRSGGSGARSG